MSLENLKTLKKGVEHINVKIIVANYRYFIAGGPERYMFNFISEAEKCGVICIPFSVDYQQNIKTPYSKYFVKPRGGKDQLNFKDIKKTPRNLWGLLQSSIYNFEAERKLRQLIQDEKPDAVYILHEINSLSPSIIRAAKKEGVRVVHRISDFFMICPKLDFLCGQEICESCMHGRYLKAIRKCCVKDSLGATLVRVMAMKLYQHLCLFEQVDAYITTCEFTKDKLAESGVPIEKIICVPTFTKCDNIKPCYSNKGYILYLGRIALQKGVIYAVKAIEKLKDLPIVLKITGTLDNSSECNEIMEFIHEHGLENKIDFVGFQNGESLQRLIDGALCVVNPSIWYENMPNTVLEAYAHGKPVVASRLGSLMEIVEDEYTGLLFEVKNVDDLAQQIRRLIKNPSLVFKLGKNARAQCEKKYNPKVQCQKVLQILSNSYESGGHFE